MRVLSWFVQPVAHGRTSLLDLIRSGQGKRAVAVVRREEQRNASVPPFSKEALAELHRRVRDFEDPRRYVIATCWTRKRAAFFDVKRGVYAVDEITKLVCSGARRTPNRWPWRSTGASSAQQNAIGWLRSGRPRKAPGCWRGFLIPQPAIQRSGRTDRCLLAAQLHPQHAQSLPLRPAGGTTSDQVAARQLQTLPCAR